MIRLSAYFCVIALLLVAVASPVVQANSAEELIWPRIAQGMRIVDAEEPETVTWARYYAERPHQFNQMLARAEPFLWYIVEAVELREMPLEIALLPAVESGFNPHARSQSKAQGLWQFVPRTGKSLGLRQTAHYDGRRDVVASTKAALDYLQRLNRRFDSWLLALAAYNVGDTFLARAIRTRGDNKFWNLELPTETREHVPRLLGVALLIKQPLRFGVELPPVRNQPAAEMIYLDGPRDLGRAIAKANISIETVEQFNPGLKNLSNSSGKRVLLLPREDAIKLRAELAHRQYTPTRAPKDVEHVIASGDSLWMIARQYQVSVAQLRLWNELRADSKLRPGRTLRVQIAS